MKNQRRTSHKLALRTETLRMLSQLELRAAAGGLPPETHNGTPCPTTAFSCPPFCPDTGALC